MLTVDDLNDPSVPEMYANDVDIAPLFKVKKYDPAKHIRVRVISDFADPKWLKNNKLEYKISIKIITHIIYFDSRIYIFILTL